MQELSSSIQRWGVCCFLQTDQLHGQCTGSSKSGTTLHGGGEEEKINIFSFLSWKNVREALKGKVSQLICYDCSLQGRCCESEIRRMRTRGEGGGAGGIISSILLSFLASPSRSPRTYPVFPLESILSAI